MNAFVHPDLVRDYKAARLARAFDALSAHGQEVARAQAAAGRSARTALRELRRLVDAWSDYAGAPVDWLSAPGELERGLDLEARLVHWLRQGGEAFRTGEFLGAHTVAELRDLLSAHQVTADRLNRAAKACTEWPACNADGFAKWSARLDAANAQFAKAAEDARARIAMTPSVLENVIPAGAAWDALIAAARAYTDLDRDLQSQSACAVEGGPLPQPTASDPDLGIYNWTEHVTKPIDAMRASASSFARGGAPWLVLAAVGGFLFLAIRR